ncbi:YegP family protein [Mycobacterium sp. E2479]|uniref:YegP family protein n=1 Tax=Mycobacterium sp. E2479 TaxID=1834134 RepID=UPI0009EF4DCC|nr:YegP family protein [Mycobacterium sp. E2479]
MSTDHPGNFRFHLKAANCETIAGRGYKTKASAEKGIEAVKTSASAANVGPDRTGVGAQLARSPASSLARHQYAARGRQRCAAYLNLRCRAPRSPRLRGSRTAIPEERQR